MLRQASPLKNDRLSVSAVMCLKYIDSFLAIAFLISDAMQCGASGIAM